MRIFLLALLFVFISASLPVPLSQPVPEIRREDKIRIKEAYSISKLYGEKLWKGWDNAPFAILLVTDDNEYLINHPEPTPDFTLIGYDSLLTSNLYTRPKKFNNNFLATFPAVGSVSTIVMGLPENTSRPSVDWIITILHEHFHQYQYSQADYQTSVNALDLSGGDNSGMWMLNYPFPYTDDKIAEQYKALTLAARDAAFAEVDFEARFKSYLADREKFKSLLNEKDYRYFSFQIWQEGLARHTEVKLAEVLKGTYTPTGELKALSDYKNIDSFYTKITDKLKKRAETQDLKNNMRDCFYTLGAFEGIILDKAAPNWRDMYFTDKFYIEKYYPVR